MTAQITISAELCPSINCWEITTAPTVDEFHAFLGIPSRIVDPSLRAPAGHRNNQVHIYDALGLVFLEHHYTRRMMGGTIVFWPEEYFPASRPRAAFCGTTSVAGYVVPSAPNMLEFLKASPIPFRPFLAGVFSARRGEFYVGINGKGVKLPSGRRSRNLRLVDLSFSWPHDNWGQTSGD